MIQAKTLEELEIKLAKGLKKAKDVFPEFKMVEYGFYEVKGSKGNFYGIRAGRTGTGEFFIACPCRGALEGNGCYHAAVVFIIHQREAKKIKESIIDPSTQPYFSDGNVRDEDKPKPTQIGNMRI